MGNFRRHAKAAAHKEAVLAYLQHQAMTNSNNNQDSLLGKAPLGSGFR